ncbi:sugar-binding protein [Fredinandcohnia quinoae]|uniref:Sugar-binding protein n=1 Tax=Fredinandcohnia quinoae TaxID=2918902 RepID=A0AAW5E9S6_9BACI|nr:sugar-binding protein [Fredinandcohnia sp. SECRCQ15]
MSRLAKILYSFGVTLFLISFSLTCYYTFKIFHFDHPTSQNTTEKPRYHFVLVPEELDNDYWRLVENGAKDAAKHHNVLLEYIGPTQANTEEHIKTLEMSAAAKVDGIMTQGLNEEQTTPLINRIVDKGIPVITVDTDAINSNRMSYIGTDNYYSGFIAGKALIEDTGGNANVAIITGRFDASHQQLRVQGFQDAVKDVEGIHIVTIEESNITRVKAAEAANKVLQEYPEVNAFYGTSALDGIGIAQVVEYYNRQDEMYILAFDTIVDTIHYMEKGTIEATVVQEPYEMGYSAVKMMIDLIEGKHVPQTVHTETRIIRKKDLPLDSRDILGVSP